MNPEIAELRKQYSDLIYRVFFAIEDVELAEKDNILVSRDYRVHKTHLDVMVKTNRRIASDHRLGYLKGVRNKLQRQARDLDEIINNKLLIK